MIEELVPVSEHCKDLPGENVETGSTVSPKRVLFVAASPKYGGTEKHLLDLIERMLSPETAVSILCTGEDVFSPRLSQHLREAVQIYRHEALSGFWNWARIFRQLQPHAVVLVRSWTWCFPWYALLAAWAAGVQVRYAISHLPPSGTMPAGLAWLSRWRYRLSHRRLAVACSKTICVSDFIRNHLVSQCGFPVQRTVTVRNGVSLHAYRPQPEKRTHFRERLHVPGGRVCLVCIASLVDQKRVDILLEALALVNRRSLPCYCIVLGDGPLQTRLQTQADLLGLKDIVRFDGFHTDVRSYLWAADALVLTSDSEGLPLSVLEAMACGLPCIVTDVGGSAEAVLHEECGLVVQPRSPVEVAEAIAFLIEHPDKRAAMAESALRRARSHFDLERSMAAVIRHIEA